jgi:hypothetical protein
VSHKTSLNNYESVHRAGLCDRTQGRVGETGQPSNDFILRPMFTVNFIPILKQQPLEHTFAGHARHLYPFLALSVGRRSRGKLVSAAPK